MGSLGRFSRSQTWPRWQESLGKALKENQTLKSLRLVCDFRFLLCTLRVLNIEQISKLPGELLLEFAPKHLEFYAYSRYSFEVVAPFFLIEVFVTVFQIGSD